MKQKLRIHCNFIEKDCDFTTTIKGCRNEIESGKSQKNLKIKTLNRNFFTKMVIIFPFSYLERQTYMTYVRLSPKVAH